MTNLPAVLSTLETQIGALTEKLAPATEDHISKAVRSLLAAGLALPSGMKVEKAPEIYAYALAGIPAFGVQKATGCIIRGEYEINRGFVPTPPEFAAMARLESKSVREDLMRLREKQATLQEAATPREKTDEQQMARIRKLYAEFKAAHAESKVTDRFRQQIEEMTPEQAQYWETISAMRDAPSISEEQMAFRRKIGKEIEASKPDEQQAAQ